MIFIYSKHIQKRLLQRNLTHEMIAQTVTQPDRTLPAFRGRYLAQKNFHGKILEVVCTEADSQTILITAYWLEERP